MSTNLEIEFKSDITKEEYESLISKFDAKKIYRQTNYYIDSDSLIIRVKKCGLRIRETNGDFELTLKVPALEGKLEINQQISNKMFENLASRDDFPEGEVKLFLEEKLEVKSSDLHILGKLVTDRLDVRYKTSLISIDKSKYNGFTDYEVEAEDESLDAAQNNLLKFLNQNDVKYKKSSGTKLKRFLKTLIN